MTSRFVSVDSEQFKSFLLDLGFHETVYNSEEVFVKSYEKFDKYKFKIKVFTSIRENRQHARECGADAIKVCAILENKNKIYGIAKLPRVYRTGSQELIHSRVKERINDAIKRCDEWMKKNQKLRSIEELLDTNNRAIERAIVVLFDRQLFDAIHLDIASYYYSWIKSGNHLTGKYINEGRRIVKQYIKELTNIAEEKIKQ
jgi:hypothetical protein